MRIRETDFEKSLAVGHVVFKDKGELYLNDSPNVFDADGYLSIYLERDGRGGTYLMPNGMFNMPKSGDLIKSKMNSGNYCYFLILSFTQDYVSAKGSIIKLCYVQDWDVFINMAKIEDKPKT